MQILQIIAPIFLVILIGYLGRRFGLINSSHNHWLNQLVYFVSLPALIVSSFWAIDLQNDVLLSALFNNLLILLVVALVSFVVLLRLKIQRGMRAAAFMAILVGNSIYMGFPIATHALPDAKPLVVLVATAQLIFSLLLSLAVIEFFVVRSRKFAVYLRDVALNPLAISLAAGIILGALVPINELFRPVKSTLEMLGATASPLALFSLGAFLHGRFLREHLQASLTVSFLKLIALPFSVLIFFRLAGAAGTVPAASVLIAAMPVAATTFVLAEKYNLEKHFSANAIIISTVLSALTLPIWLAVL